jgi:hypothetical protein
LSAPEREVTSPSDFKVVGALHHSLNTKKKTMTYDVRNPGPGLGQAQKCSGVKPVNVDIIQYIFNHI